MKLMMANQHESQDPFADYMWMGEMDQFDQEVEAQIEKDFAEEEFIRSCIEQLLDEEEEQTVFFQSQQDNVSNGHANGYTNNGYPPTNGFNQVPNGFHEMNGNMANTFITRPYEKPKVVNQNVAYPAYHNVEHVPRVVQQKKSTLNPNAAPFIMNPKAKEFVPRTSPPQSLQQEPRNDMSS